MPAHVIEESNADGTMLLNVLGELDVGSLAVVGAAVMEAITSHGSVIIDLSDLTFCDSGGVGMFIAAHDKARARGTVLTIRRLRPAVRRLFESTNLDRLLGPI